MELFKRGDIKREAKDKLKGHWAVAIGMLFIGIVPSLIESTLSIFIDKETTIGSLILTLILFGLASIVGLATTKFYLGVSREDIGKLSENVKFGVTYLIKYITVSVIYGLSVAIGILLFIAPGIIIGIKMQFALTILADNPDFSAIECIKRSFSITKGHKFEIFLFNLSFILWVLLSIITVGIALIYVIPYLNTSIMIYYNRLSAAYETENMVAEV